MCDIIKIFFSALRIEKNYSDSTPVRTELNLGNSLDNPYNSLVDSYNMSVELEKQRIYNQQSKQRAESINIVYVVDNIHNDYTQHLSLNDQVVQKKDRHGDQLTRKKLDRDDHDQFVKQKYVYDDHLVQQKHVHDKQHTEQFVHDALPNDVQIVHKKRVNSFQSETSFS